MDTGLFRCPDLALWGGIDGGFSSRGVYVAREVSEPGFKMLENTGVLLRWGGIWSLVLPWTLTPCGSARDPEGCNCTPSRGSVRDGAHTHQQLANAIATIRCSNGALQPAAQILWCWSGLSAGTTFSCRPRTEKGFSTRQQATRRWLRVGRSDDAEYGSVGLMQKSPRSRGLTVLFTIIGCGLKKLFWTVFKSSRAHSPL